MINSLNSLSPYELVQFWGEYLPALSKSIKVQGGHTNNPDAFSVSKGFGDSFNGVSWGDRAKNWYRDPSTVLYSLEHKRFYQASVGVDATKIIPMFPRYVKEALERINRNPCKDINLKGTQTARLTNPQQETNTMKNELKATMSSVLNKNTDAVAIATKLSAGKAANSFFLNKLLGEFPWYAKLFSKKNKVAENPIAKMVAAQTAMALVTHFAPENKKLNYIADGMAQEALVDVTLNSKVLEKMILELESIVSLPDFKE